MTLCEVKSILFENTFKFLEIFGNELDPAGTFGARFATAAILWMVLIIMAVKRYSAVSTFNSWMLVGVAGMAFGFAREMNMLILEWGFFHGIYSDKSLFYSFSPTEHFWTLLSTMCLCWMFLRNAEVFDWTYYLKPRWLWIVLPVAIMSYSTVEWFKYISTHVGSVIRFRDVLSDTIWHIINFVILFYTYARTVKVKFSIWTTMFFLFWMADHLTRAIMFGFGIECSRTMTIVFNLHIWGIITLILHVSTKAIDKLNREEVRVCPCHKYLEDSYSQFKQW